MIKLKRKPISNEARVKLSLAKIGNRNGFKKGKSSAFLGRKHTLESKKKMSDSLRKNPTKYWLGKIRPDMRGQNNKRWTGNTPINKSIRAMAEYKQWRSNVFERDDWTCQTCGIRGIVLEVHHINAFADILKTNYIKTIQDALLCSILWDISNGVSLCRDCHALTDNYKGKYHGN